MARVNTPQDRVPIIHEGLPTQLPDIDPEETQEWVDSFDRLLDERGRARARYVMLRLLERSREKQVGVPALRSTDYVNTIPPEREPWFPGDEETERRIRSYVRWNAAVMVAAANRKGLEVGGHIATYQSSASLYEVGFNHFFRGKDHPGGGSEFPKTALKNNPAGRVKMSLPAGYSFPASCSMSGLSVCTAPVLRRI